MICLLNVQQLKIVCIYDMIFVNCNWVNSR